MTTKGNSIGIANPARQATNSLSLARSPVPTLSAGLVPLAQSGSTGGSLVTVLPVAALLP